MSEGCVWWVLDHNGEFKIIDYLKRQVIKGMAGADLGMYLKR